MSSTGSHPHENGFGIQPDYDLMKACAKPRSTEIQTPPCKELFQLATHTFLLGSWPCLCALGSFDHSCPQYCTCPDGVSREIEVGG